MLRLLYHLIKHWWKLLLIGPQAEQNVFPIRERNCWFKKEHLYYEQVLQCEIIKVHYRIFSIQEVNCYEIWHHKHLEWLKRVTCFHTRFVIHFPSHPFTSCFVFFLRKLLQERRSWFLMSLPLFLLIEEMPGNFISPSLGFSRSSTIDFIKFLPCIFL